ncbi:DNA cytosine methyltransferase [Anaeromyxobacter oryzisoli]|uniref:DNA cytosine methyltransferase n=1 Tax=Anaeromyxobacter oryzisoli TaxID=2925408 RepID=UPI001F595410|nr:DNA cytosine methyltransferase [Anaeromyxobacter sp. SG63]
MSEKRDFTVLFPFCGLGAGARGFIEAMAQLGRDRARFVNLGGIDIDPEACTDFEQLADGPSLCADMATLTPAELLAFAGARRPDCVFLSPPCKGFSRLLPTKSAEREKYQALNRLVLQGLFLICETWPEPPSAIIVENVPGIMSRGAPLLVQVRQLLARYGYVFHEGTHDCGEIGGLGQHRRRFLLVARRPAAVPAFIYRPPLQRVKGCGEVLGRLPLPEDSGAGELHRLPKISWLNWVRLALIPAGGDWRDLPASIPEALLAQTAAGAASFKGRPGLMRVNGWDMPTPAVTGSASVSGSNGTAAVADPRILSPVRPGQARREVFAKYDVRPWWEPARTVAGSGTNGGFAVADPRVALDHSPYRGALGVVPWSEPSPTVRGVLNVRTGPGSVADPRPTCVPRATAYGVLRWDEAAATVTGGRIDNGTCAVADPRRAPKDVPVIVAADGTWHRPMTLLDRAALQGLPARVRGAPLRLAGRSTASWGERIGNAVPVQAATAIAESILKALLAGSLGTWFLSAEGIWARGDGKAREEMEVREMPEVAHG